MTHQVKKILFMYAEEPIHAGAGTSTGTIDLPIQRERHINVPKIEGSGVRGAIREAAWEIFSNQNTSEAQDLSKGHDAKDKQNDFTRVFGFKNDGANHSAIDISDAHLLFFPVRSWKGVFVWLTCPLLLKRFIKDYNRMFGVESNNVMENLENFINTNTIADNQAFVQCETVLKTDNDKALFEEYLFDAEEKDIFIGDTKIGEWFQARLGSAHAIINMLPKHIAVVSDEVFMDFADLYTHKITRNRIDSATGTAEGMGLFNEEFLPSESILYTNLVASNEFKESNFMKADKVMKFVEKYLPDLYKTGGDQGIGKGLFRVAFYHTDNENGEQQENEGNQTNTQNQ